MQKIIIALSLVTTMLMLNACNTFQGLGRDIKRGGEKLEKTAEHKKNETSNTGAQKVEYRKVEYKK